MANASDRAPTHHVRPSHGQSASSQGSTWPTVRAPTPIAAAMAVQVRPICKVMTNGPRVSRINNAAPAPYRFSSFHCSRRLFWAARMATSMLSNVPYSSPESTIRITSPHMSDSIAAGSFPSHEKQLLPLWYHAIIAREWQALPAERRGGAQCWRETELTRFREFLTIRDIL